MNTFGRTTCKPKHSRKERAIALIVFIQIVSRDKCPQLQGTQNETLLERALAFPKTLAGFQDGFAVCEFLSHYPTAVDAVARGEILPRANDILLYVEQKRVLEMTTKKEDNPLRVW